MIGILAFAIATAIAYFAAPSMPLYSARDIQLKRFRFSFTEWTVSLEILAGVEIDNGNIVGGDLYSTLVDIYYPDWNGHLLNIGYLRETKQEITDYPKCEDTNITGGKNAIDQEDHGICIPNKKYLNSQPFFTVQSRGISTTEPGAITIYLNRIPPKIYLNIVKDIIRRWGSMNLLVSGVAHVKSPLGLPLSLGVICDNYLDLTKLPLQVVGKECIVERISTGWSGLEELALEVKERILGYYVDNNGDIFGSSSTPITPSPSSSSSITPDVTPGTTATKSRTGRNTNSPREPEDQRKVIPKSSMDQLFLSSEVILDWHDF
jgi:hypothetical protein